MIVGIVYQPPNQTNSIKTLNEHFAKFDTTNKVTYIPGNFNINVYHNGKCIICKNNTLVSRSVSNDARNYHQFCTICGLKKMSSLKQARSQGTTSVCFFCRNR